jgi:acyl carrier protein
MNEERLNMSSYDRLAAVFEKTFGFDAKQFSPQLAPEQVPNWDSIGHMSLVAALEQEFGLQFEVDEIMEMSSPRKIFDILKSKGIAE